ncbi:glycoside hydrolase family 78 protein [Cylindrobasidium torrendii FP15055 ss-10]|uniref:Glycoside hydrolase family 78 protein n=1 Tax=Cylindrobasidium torrendii FP15055 ss-10 TaxID=1314674 RepID=A0A0D7AW99_9AGAR|nr:glycoside hydrolase family 78 protein [Cylindrobasidium torrendii FP15055 ss-10]
MLRASYVALVSVSTAAALAPSGPWDAFNFAPSSRTVYPTAIYKLEGTIQGADQLVQNAGTATLAPGSWVALDYGVEVGGLVSITFDIIADNASFALSFTESPMFVNPLASDDSSNSAINMTYDGILDVRAPISEGLWTQPAERLRGGFRYLTIVSKADTDIELSNVSCEISFMPHVEDLRAYTGYFYASDPDFHDEDFLTKIWYAGAYTIQTNTVPLNTGRQVPFASAGSWYNNASLGVAGPIIVDGAKRDRAVWPGDMGIAVPAQFVSTFDLIPTRNALSTMFSAINPETGALPESGPPLSQKDSDTYHAWTLIGTHNYYLYSGDTDWLENVWENYTHAVAFLERKADSSGLMNVTGLRDWARLGGGGHNAEGNALLYGVLTTASDLASYLDKGDLASSWAKNATALKARFNEEFWVEETGMYRDNATTTLSPQDANSLAVIYNLTINDDQKNRISEGLTVNWNDLGSVAPELPDTISPFIGGFELQAHFESGNDARALDLLHREWGYMLYTNLSVQSTLLEGYTANGSLGYRSYRGYNYDAAYTSHAHGWSAGPTSALTFYVLGLKVTSPKGATWDLNPHINGGLPAAEGGFETGLGWFGVNWTLGADSFELELDTPEGTEGVFHLPLDGPLSVDGQEVDVGGLLVPLSGGKHSIIIST